MIVLFKHAREVFVCETFDLAVGCLFKKKKKKKTRSPRESLLISLNKNTKKEVESILGTKNIIQTAYEEAM